MLRRVGGVAGRLFCAPYAASFASSVVLSSSSSSYSTTGITTVVETSTSIPPAATTTTVATDNIICNSDVGVSSIGCGWLRPTQVLLGNKGGTPKHRKSPYRIRRKSYGVSFQRTFSQSTPWYYCPLCAEPKTEGEWCRREDCRQIKP